MANQLTFGVFGRPPKDLVGALPEARQFSSLVPGSESLATCEPLSLSGFTMLASPGTIERRYQLALALRALKENAPLVVLSPKDKGGSRLAKELREFGCEPEEEAKSHHRICRVNRPAELQNLEETIAAGAPRLAADLELWTQPGIFSWDRLDQGSALLLEQLPEFSGRGADLGCGLGVLSRTILRSRSVKHLTLLEIDGRAVDCARKNITDGRVSFLWADLRRTNEIAKESLDFIVTNPPFHDGGQEDQSLGQEFVRKAAEWLKPDGKFWIVANRHLAYEALLHSLFSSSRAVVEAGGFKIYEAKK